MKHKLDKLRRNLAAVFDDNLHTRKWHNIADYLIIGMILLSSVEIFLSTFNLHPTLRKVLMWIDIVTLIFFTIEVTLRIWVAPIVSPKFKGWKGRLRYCFTFHGFVDVISTYPFYLQWLIPFPVGWMKILRMSRTVRLFRISRYMKSWRLLTGAIAEKRRELIISMQFLIIITFILSLMLYFFEHDVQPEVYDNGFATVAWSFAQYIGDPGGFGDTPPVTGAGRVIACVVGLLGIAIVAVPAGILGAGFSEAIEKETKHAKHAEDAKKVHAAFQRKLDRPSGYQVMPPFVSLSTIQTKLAIKGDDIVDLINSPEGKEFRLVNLATTIPMRHKAADNIAVEHFMANRPYGCYIDRGSEVTIVAPASFCDACTGNWAFYLALIGGFNYISREVGDRANYKSFFIIDDEDNLPNFKEFKDDLLKLTSRPGAWSVAVMAASGNLDPEYPTQVHLQAGGRKGDSSLHGDNMLVKDTATYEQFYRALSEELEQDFNIAVDHQQYHDSTNPNLLPRKANLPNSNNIIMRVEWDKMLWDPRRILIAKTVARCLCESLLHKELPDNDAILKSKELGFDGYDNRETQS